MNRFMRRSRWWGRSPLVRLVMYGWKEGRKEGSFAVLLLMCMENIIVLFEVHWHDKLVCA